MIATDALDGVGLIDELRCKRPTNEFEVATVASVVERSAVKHAVAGAAALVDLPILVFV